MVFEKVREWKAIDWGVAGLSWTAVFLPIIFLTKLLNLGQEWKFLMGTILPAILTFRITEWLKEKRRKKGGI